MPESVEPFKPRLDGTPERYREVWGAFYAKQKPDEANLRPLVAQMSAALARGVFSPSVVRLLEERLALQPGELLSGVVTILNMTKRSMQAEAAIYDPRRKRYEFALVNLFAPEDLATVADALRLLKEWQHPKGEVQK